MNNYRNVLIVIISIFFLTCRDNCDNSLSVGLSFIDRGDHIRVKINNELVFDQDFDENYSYLSSKKKLIIKDYCTSVQSNIAIQINNRDTNLIVPLKSVKDLIIGRDMYNNILIDYYYTNGTHTLEFSED